MTLGMTVDLGAQTVTMQVKLQRRRHPVKAKMKTKRE
jgi:hypothetical protein